MESRRVRLLIRGKVQGVFFRQSALARATELHLLGFVRNLPTGEVEAVAEGAADSIEFFIHWCGGGPPGARVEGVEVTERTDHSALTAFHVEVSP
jgi:acylphosphatase